MKTAKLRIIAEVLRSLASRAYTLKYPRVASPAPQGFRGKLEYDIEKCTGCAACVQNCPAAALKSISNGDRRTIEVWYGKCIYCGRCEEVCPERAITLTTTYSLVTGRKEEIKSSVQLEINRCLRCGKPVATARQIDKVRLQVKDLVLPEDYDAYLSSLCFDCRKTVQAGLLLAGRI